MRRYRRLTVPEISARKVAGRPVSMVTCYDHWTARILNETDIDCLLVGDSVAMVVHGYDSTVHADTDMMALHVSAVCRGAPDKLVVADMPFLAARKGLRVGMDAIQSLMQAGAQAIKIEGEQGVTELIAHSVESGVPIMGHLGLTPQSVHALGGMRVQGRADPAVHELLESARRLQDAGCFAIVLECVPSAVGKQVAETVEIPVIGIGAGADTDGQVLVLQDLLGADPSFKPRFVRRYLDLHGDMQAAVNRFHADVHGRGFPGVEESYA